MHQGSCLCRSITYEIDSDLKAVVNCHCRYCRKAHGAAFTTLLFMPFSNLRVIAGAERIARFPVPGLNADRCFCDRCGTRLYNHAPASGMVSVVVATLDSDEPVRPRAHINTESKCPWWAIGDDGLPQFAAVPAPAEFGRLLSS